MTLQGTVVNGQIVLDESARLPDGTRVEVTVKEEAKPAEAEKPTLRSLLKYAGCITDMPPDFAEQHDHYIHGTPKR